MAGLPEKTNLEDVMKKTYQLAIVGAGMMVLALSGSALAFHAGGVAHCDGCHSMHNSVDNPVNPGAENSMLTKGLDSSSTCLNCHAGSGGYHIASDDGSNMNAGGDFFWVKTDFTVMVRGNPVVYSGMNTGHSIVAADYTGYTADTTNTTAPGGTYSADLLGCTSCHDAHGQVMDGTKAGNGPISVSGSYGAADPTDGSIHGNYRILGDALYEAGHHDADGFAFSQPAPIARANSYNGYSVDYGSNMSEWCANCHGDFLVGSSTAHKHPAGNAVHLNGYASNYNNYVASGDFTGDALTSYDPLVSFERGVDDGSLLDVTSTAGPDNNSNIMCLTCHRAHASAFQNAGRWDFEVELLAESHALEATDLPATAVPYYKNGAPIDIATEYGPWQRSLCNKCHVQD